MEDITFDSRGLMWFGNNYWRATGVVRYDAAADRFDVGKEFQNQDGVSLTMTFFNSLSEDRQSNIWFSTNVGPVYISADQAASGGDSFTLVQPKIPRNDGSNLADYLLNNIECPAMAIDGADRKWFGTSGNGVYLISADNMTQLHHFTSENSPLLSDNIRAIAINDATGEVFIGTDRGLCSFMADATAPAAEMDADNVYAYPNPVRPDFTGSIAITGLMDNSLVKIADAAGNVVRSLQSIGGTAIWDGCNAAGRRVKTGVYFVLVSQSDGSSSSGKVATKILFVN